MTTQCEVSIKLASEMASVKEKRMVNKIIEQCEVRPDWAKESIHLSTEDCSVLTEGRFATCNGCTVRTIIHNQVDGYAEGAIVTVDHRNYPDWPRDVFEFRIPADVVKVLREYCANVIASSASHESEEDRAKSLSYIERRITQIKIVEPHHLSKPVSNDLPVTP